MTAFFRASPRRCVRSETCASAGGRHPADGRWNDEPVKPARRKRTSAVLGEGRCSLCGGKLMLATSRKVRTWTAWLNPLWNPDVQVHEVCSSCGARREIYADAGR